MRLTEVRDNVNTFQHNSKAYLHKATSSNTRWHEMWPIPAAEMCNPREKKKTYSRQGWHSTDRVNAVRRAATATFIHQ
jgi:hypothetical protein